MINKINGFCLILYYIIILYQLLINTINTIANNHFKRFFNNFVTVEISILFSEKKFFLQKSYKLSNEITINEGKYYLKGFTPNTLKLYIGQ